MSTTTDVDKMIANLKVENLTLDQMELFAELLDSAIAGAQGKFAKTEHDRFTAVRDLIMKEYQKRLPRSGVCVKCGFDHDPEGECLQ